ncbi:MAG: hypothetical protein U1F65_05130 [Verrucomicrobiota bacterium]
MMPTTKTRSISPRTLLVDSNAVRALHGISTRRVFEWVESGKIIWAFNVGTAASRDLRFWSKELYDLEDVSAWMLETVISHILPPSRKTFGFSEIEQIFLISPTQVCRLFHMLGCPASVRPVRVSRQALATFLNSRWIGGQS